MITLIGIKQAVGPRHGLLGHQKGMRGKWGREQGVVPAARPHRSGIVSAVFLSAISWQERRYRWGLPQKSADKHGGDADQNDRNDQRNQEDQNRDAQKAQ